MSCNLLHRFGSLNGDGEEWGEKEIKDNKRERGSMESGPITYESLCDIIIEMLKV